jgi:uncharacterized delta-60 repeat protein
MSRRTLALLSLLTCTACGFDVPLGSDDAGTCGTTRIAGFALDKTFGTCGRVAVDLGGLDNVGVGTQGIALDAQGRAVLAARGGVPGTRHLFIVRLQEDGSLDPTFGSNGAADVGVFNADEAHAVRVQPDGKLVVAGHTDDFMGEPFGIAGRVLENGQLDLPFGFQNTGHQKLGSGSTCLGLVLRADGSMVCTGSGFATWPGPGDVRAVAIDSAGQLLTGFGTSGAVSLDFASASDFGGAGLETPEGKLVIPGRTGGDFALVRLDANGVPDPSFTDARALPGRVTVDFEGGDDECFAVLVSNGTTWCAGHATVGGARVGALVRVTASGALDPSFGAAGKLALPEWRTVYALLPLADGRVLLAGDAVGAGGLAQAFQVVDATGRPEGTVVTLDLSPGDDSARALVRDAAGRLFVSGVLNDGPADDVVVHRFIDVSTLRLGVAGGCSSASGASLWCLLLWLVGRNRLRH